MAFLVKIPVRLASDSKHKIERIRAILRWAKHLDGKQVDHKDMKKCPLGTPCSLIKDGDLLRQAW